MKRRIDMLVNDLYNLFIDSDVTGDYIKFKLTDDALETDINELYCMITVIQSEAVDLEVNDYLTKEDLMNMLHIKSDKALKLMRSQLLNSIKIGKQYLTRRVWSEEFFEKYKNQTIDI